MVGGSGGVSLEPLSFTDLEGFDADDARAALAVFAGAARALAAERPPLRAAVAPSPALRRVARAALAADGKAASRFFTDNFRPFRVRPEGPRGFVTGYYEPWVLGSATPTPEFTAPILARPPDLASRAPYPYRAAIETEARAPLLWLVDAVEVFLIQVQGSARVELTDGRRVRLVYDGRNGLPYTSIGRLLIEAGEIPESKMSLARLKAWLRANGLQPGEPARELMRRNRSYIFFRIEEGFAPDEGPIGGAGLPLTPLRSIAVDRAIWPYGTPFWIDARLPWRDETAEPFRRLMIAQDTGSAILGPARADIFFGGGGEAGARAGAIRHAADFTVLLPIGDEV
jgi:membrane-bound lytic murein transglycosylase A